MKTLALIFFPLLLAPSSAVESLKKDVLEVNRYFAGIREQQVETHYTLYKSAGDAEPMAEYDATVYYGSGRRYVKTPDVEKIETKDWQLLINHEPKEMYLFRQPQTLAPLKPADLAGLRFDWIDQLSDHVSMTESAKETGQVTYAIRFPEQHPAFREVRLGIDRARRHLTAMDVFYKNTEELFEESIVRERSEHSSPAPKPASLHSRLNIRFSYKAKPDISLIQINLDQFITGTGKTARPVGKYASYTLHQ